MVVLKNRRGQSVLMGTEEEIKHYEKMFEEFKALRLLLFFGTSDVDKITQP